MQACASGTQFDVTSGTCTWPDGVDCKTGSDLLSQVGSGGDGSDDEDEASRFCPERYTGRAPSTNCKGYVECANGVGGLSAKCPPSTEFNHVTQQCQYDLDGCDMLNGDDGEPASNEPKHVNELDQYCPTDFTGRAPTENCEGYVDCKNGQAKRSKSCPGTTRFSAMIMACTYVESGCDAVQTDDPTPPPLTKVQMDELREEPVGCPDGHTGNVALPGCESYVYCSNGNEISRVKCGDGTLFNVVGGFCNWAAEVTCETTKMPSQSPTESPSQFPTVQPTLNPVELDLDGTVYYPNFTSGTCPSDGNQPADVGRQYLFADATSCCNRYFAANMDACVQASAPTTSPTPAAGATWYPDYDNSVCKNDDQHSDHETNFFFTVEECCAFDFIKDEVGCLREAPAIQDVAYYPDYTTNACKNDGMQSPFESNVFGSMEECCQFEWIDYGLCITGGSGGDQEDGGENDGSPDEEEDGMEYYPD